MLLYLNFTNKDHIYTTATCSWQTSESFANIFIKLFLSLFPFFFCLSSMGIHHYTPGGCCPCSLLSSYTQYSDAAATDLCRRPIVRKSAPNLCKLKFHSRNTWPGSATNSQVTIVSGMMNVCSTIHNIHTHTHTQTHSHTIPGTDYPGNVCLRLWQTTWRAV